MKLRNKYYIMRHGQAVSNVKEVISSWPEKFHNPLTRQGKEMIRESAQKLINKNVDFIFCSPLLRTVQTAEIVGKAIGVEPKKDKRLREIGFGILSGCSIKKMWNYFDGEEQRITKRTPRGEVYPEVLNRMMSFLKNADKKYKGKSILLVSHEGPLFLLQGKVMGFSIKETIKKFPLGKRIHKGEIRELN